MTIEVWIEKGNEVPQFHALIDAFNSDSGKTEVRKGEMLKMGLYLMDGVLCPRPGNYYAVSNILGYAFSGAVNVRFGPEVTVV